MSLERGTRTERGQIFGPIGCTEAAGSEKRERKRAIIPSCYIKFYKSIDNYRKKIYIVIVRGNSAARNLKGWLIMGIYNKRQRKNVTWIDTREAKPPYNKIVLLFFGEDKNVYFGYYTNEGWIYLQGCYVGCEKCDVKALMCSPVYWAYLPNVPNF